jgi:hypothetical protein
MPMRITELETEDAYVHWKVASENNIFTNPYVLIQLSHKVRWFAAVKGSHIKCVWPVCWNESGQIIRPNFTYWVGPIWAKGRDKVATHSHLSENSDVYGAYIDFFEENEIYLNFEMSIKDHDVRFFDWWNFNHDKKTEFTISPRYSAQLDLSKFRIEDYRRNRKRQLRDFKDGDFWYSQEMPEQEDLVNLYEIELGGKISPDIRNSLIRLVKIAEQGYGSFVSVYSTKTKELCGFSLVLSSGNQANHVLNLSDIESKKCGLHVWLTNSAIQNAIRGGWEIFDFNGANSPLRGDDKHSYGASYKLYFTLLQRKSEVL